MLRFCFQLTKASISLNNFRILVEQEWPDSIASSLENSSINLFSCNEIVAEQLVYRFVFVFLNNASIHVIKPFLIAQSAHAERAHARSAIAERFW